MPIILRQKQRNWTRGTIQFLLSNAIQHKRSSEQIHPPTLHSGCPSHFPERNPCVPSSPISQSCSQALLAETATHLPDKFNSLLEHPRWHLSHPSLAVSSLLKHSSEAFQAQYSNQSGSSYCFSTFRSSLSLQHSMKVLHGCCCMCATVTNTALKQEGKDSQATHYVVSYSTRIVRKAGDTEDTPSWLEPRVSEWSFT